MRGLWLLYAAFLHLVGALDQSLSSETLELPTLKCSLFGFSHDKRDKSFPTLIDSQRRIYRNETFDLFNLRDGRLLAAFPYCAADENSSTDSDVCVIYVNPLYLFNEDGLLSMLQSGLQSIMKSDSRATLLVLSTGSTKQLGEAIQILLQEAWAATDKENFRKELVTAEFNVEIVLIPSLDFEMMNATLLEPVSRVFTSLNIGSARVLKDIIKSEKKSKKSTQKATPKLGSELKGRGIESCRKGVELTMEFAREQANDSVQKLQMAEYANDFPHFIENLVAASLEFLKRYVVSKGGASAAALLLAEREVNRLIFAMLQPFFTKQVSLARAAAVENFNNQVSPEELPVTVFIMQDLAEVRDSVLRAYGKTIARLTPRGAPSKTTWSAQFDVQLLRESLDAYLENRRLQATSQGVLPRERKPVNFMFNYFAMHPFGRDYRQDVVTLTSPKDKFLYDSEIAAARVPFVSPLIARTVLKERAEASAKSRSAIARDSELAREMLMFPLSIKNPDVPMAGTRARRKSRGGPPKKDSTRETFGPERFIRWDLSPLDVALRNVQRLQDHAAAAAAQPMGDSLKDRADAAKKVLVRGIDKVINSMPYFGNGYYEHPPINYGSSHVPSSPQDGDDGETFMFLPKFASKGSAVSQSN